MKSWLNVCPSKVISFSSEKVESLAIFLSDVGSVAFVASLFLLVGTIFRYELYFMKLQMFFYFLYIPTLYLQ